MQGVEGAEGCKRRRTVARAIRTTCLEGNAEGM